MYGVVLWRCDSSKSAVIWCDDHGDLAFLNVAKEFADQSVTLEPGDLLQFDIRAGAESELDLREAHNATWMTRDYAPELVQMLEEAGLNNQAPVATRAASRTARIIAFPDQKRQAANARQLAFS